MAITRTQIAKQLLEKGGRVGLKGGADAATKSFDRSANPGRRDGPIGRDDPPGGFDLGGGQGPTFDGAPASQLSSQAAERARKFIASQKDDRSRIAKTFNLLNPFSKQRQKLAYELSMKLPGQEKRSAKYMKAYKDYLESLGITEEDLEGDLPSANFFVNKAFKENLKPVDAMLDPPMSYGDFLLKEFNNPTVKYRGDIGRYREEMGLDNDDPPLLFPRSGIMAQAPEEDEEPEYVNPLSKLSPRIAGSQFAAGGGRIGLQEGGGIEQRLEKLGGDVTSAEKLLQGINKRLETAESSLGSGGGLGTLANMASSTPGVGATASAIFPSGPLANIPLPGSPGVPDLNKFNEIKDIFMGNMSPGKPGSLIPLEENPNFQNIPEQFRSGFANYLKENPNSFGFGGQMMSSVGLPGGGGVTFGDTGSAKAFRDYLESTGFTPPSPLGRPIQLPGIQPGASIQDLATQTGQAQQLQLNQTPPEQMMEDANSSFASMSPEERVRIAQGSLANRMLKSPQELAFLNRVIKSGGMDYLREIGDFTRRPLAQLPAQGSSGIPAVGFADGGRITSLEDMDREGFILGGVAKGLKKAVRGIKKLAKSPIGKAALTYAAFTYGPQLLSGKGFGLGEATKFSQLKLFGGDIPINPVRFAGIPAILAGLTPEEKDKFDVDSYYASNKLNPSQSTRMMGSDFDFYGGQRIASAEGGSTDKEPVAKKTMPLLDMGGKEMDLRENGGFVPIGRMEKADDVPARLSKNEFVFTADAVRNAGEGDVDKGAEVMYNMMKNLEAGGEVSEESQGLEGARKMFQTSQRLEEVL